MTGKKASNRSTGCRNPSIHGAKTEVPVFFVFFLGGGGGQTYFDIGVAYPQHGTAVYTNERANSLCVPRYMYTKHVIWLEITLKERLPPKKGGGGAVLNKKNLQDLNKKTHTHIPHNVPRASSPLKRGCDSEGVTSCSNSLACSFNRPAAPSLSKKATTKIRQAATFGRSIDRSIERMILNCTSYRVPGKSCVKRRACVLLRSINLSTHPPTHLRRLVDV